MTKSEVEKKKVLMWWRGLDDDTKEEISCDYGFATDDYGFDTDDPDEGWFKLSYKQKLEISKSEKDIC